MNDKEMSVLMNTVDRLFEKVEIKDDSEDLAYVFGIKQISESLLNKLKEKEVI